MKNKIKILILFLFIIIFGKMNVVHAVKQAIFPDSKSLQPIPQNVSPNIKGNTNSSTKYVEENTINEIIPINTVPNTVNQPEEIVKKNNTLYLVYSGVIILLIIVMVVIRKNKNKII